MLKNLSYGRQWINEDDIAEVVNILKGDWLTQGPAVDAFEKAWQHCKADCPEYFTLYKGKGSVGGEKK